MSETSRRVLARLAFITDESVRQNSTNVLAREVEALEARVAELAEEVAGLRRSLAVLAEHEPSWSDDFCRARAALKGVAASPDVLRAEQAGRVALKGES